VRHSSEKQTSSVCMTMVQSSGTWLNGAMVPQYHYVSLSVEDLEGKLVARVALTFEQVTRMLMYNGEVECTLERYRGIDGNMLEEKVEKPKTVHTRMRERLGESRQQLKARIDDLYKDIYEAVNAGAAGKKKLQELLDQAQTIQQHFGGNDDFVMQQAEEELGTMQTQVTCQLGVFLQSQHGIEADSTSLKKLLPVSDSNLLVDKSAVPVVDGYKAKARSLKETCQMTAMEVADEIHKHLKRFEALDPDRKGERASLYCPNATYSKNKVLIKYISYQGTHSFPLKEAQDYLTFLRDAKDWNSFAKRM